MRVITRPGRAARGFPRLASRGLHRVRPRVAAAWAAPRRGLGRSLARLAAAVSPRGGSAAPSRVSPRLSLLALGVALAVLGGAVTLSLIPMSGRSHQVATLGAVLSTGAVFPGATPAASPASATPTAPVSAAPVAPPRAPRLVAAPPPGSQSSYPPGSVAAIITAAADAHGVDPSWMISTASCESGLRPTAYNPSGPYYGLFQFLMSTFQAHGGTNIWDPVQQSEIAASMFAAGDSAAWPVCSRR
jgi:soluble lytic murein transglycosylase-like protein